MDETFEDIWRHFPTRLCVSVFYYSTQRIFFCIFLFSSFLYSDRTNLLKANRNHNGWRKLTTLTRWCGCIIVVVAAERKKRSASLTWRQLTNLKPQLIAALEKMFATGAWRGLQCCTAPALLWFRQSPRASVHATTFANQPMLLLLLPSAQTQPWSN